LICGKSSQAFVICFVSLLGKLIFPATVLCSIRNNPAGRVSRDIAPQAAGFYDKSFMIASGNNGLA